MEAIGMDEVKGVGMDEVGMTNNSEMMAGDIV